MCQRQLQEQLPLFYKRLDPLRPRDYFRLTRKVHRAARSPYVKIHKIVGAAPHAPVHPVSPLEPCVTLWFYVLKDLPHEHVVRLVKVDVQELFESRKVPPRRGFDGPRDKVGLWKAPWLETQCTSTVYVGKVGYASDEIPRQFSPDFGVHLVFYKTGRL